MPLKLITGKTDLPIVNLRVEYWCGLGCMGSSWGEVITVASSVKVHFLSRGLQGNDHDHKHIENAPVQLKTHMEGLQERHFCFDAQSVFSQV